MCVCSRECLVLILYLRGVFFGGGMRATESYWLQDKLADNYSFHLTFSVTVFCSKEEKSLGQVTPASSYLEAWSGVTVLATNTILPGDFSRLVKTFFLQFNVYGSMEKWYFISGNLHLFSICCCILSFVLMLVHFSQMVIMLLTKQGLYRCCHLMIDSAILNRVASF